MEGRRALLIGCPVGGLVGVENSLRRLVKSLRERSFDVDEVADVLVGEAATCRAIEARLWRLVDEADEGDAVVIAFIGHGALIDDPEGAATTTMGATRAMVQVFQPTDIRSSTADDPRVITGVGMMEVLEKLRAKTANITLILDICGAAGFLKGLAGAERSALLALNSRIRREVGELIEARYGWGAGAGGLEAGGEVRPDPLEAIVRLVASSTNEQSYQRDDGAGGITLFCEALTEVLDSGEEGLSWSRIIELVHERVHGEREDQWVGVEGPRDRLPFSLDTDAHRVPAYGCRIDCGRLFIRAGYLHGLTLGDRVVVLAPRSGGATPGAELLTGRADHVGATESTLATTEPLPESLPLGAYVAVTGDPSRRPIELAVASADGDEELLIAALERAGCRRAGPSCAPLGRLELADGWLSLVEGAVSGVAIFAAPWNPSAGVAGALVERLERLVRWRELAESGDPGAEEAEARARLELTWGVDGRGEERGEGGGAEGKGSRDVEERDEELGVGGEVSGEGSLRVRSGDVVWIRLRPQPSMEDAQIHCVVVHVDITRELHHLTQEEAHGLIIRSGAAGPDGIPPGEPALRFRVPRADWVTREAVCRGFLVTYVSPRPLTLHELVRSPGAGSLESSVPALRRDVWRVQIEYVLEPGPPRSASLAPRRAGTAAASSNLRYENPKLRF